MIQMWCGTVLFMDREQWLVIGYYLVFIALLMAVLACAAYLR